ncbi:MAG: NADH-quinone oxidoreductase subunit J [Candidatus Gastranaerophilales bacterium]|nr:NADH-quinone oxidoreductase subunit J [Candidatus Gastranaerophilales bacterium]
MEIDILKTLIFYGFAGATLFFALLSIFSFRILYSLLSAVCVFFAVAGIYFTLGADYNAVIQIAIYGIAVPILFVLAIMFTSDKLDKKTYITVQPRFFFSFFGLGVLFLSLIYLIIISLSLNSNIDWVMQKQAVFINKYQMFKAISDGFFVDYALAFELFSVLLLIVVVGISTLGLIKEKTDD